MGGLDAKTKSRFDPEGSGYDMGAAIRSGMKPSQTPGPNYGHYGSVIPATPKQRGQFGLPDESYMLLKGRQHKTFSKAVTAENRRGFEVKKFGDRYFSVPKIGTVLDE